MQISLLNGFQGALVGAAVANVLGAYRQQEWEKQGMPSWIERDHWRLGALSPVSATQPWGSQWIHSLNDWIGVDAQNWSHLGQSCREIKLSHPAVSAIALLPLILITHDDPVRQRQALATVINQASWDFPAFLAALILAAGINQALQNRLTPTGLISSLSWRIKGLENPAENQSEAQLSDPEVLSNALNLLQLIQRLVQQPVGLETAAEQLQAVSSPFAALGLALYCFLGTPEEYSLIVLRALRCRYQPQLVATLAGILAGAYKGLGGVPITWRLGIQRRQAGPAALPMLWRIPSETALRQLSEALLAGWAGADKQQFVRTINFKHPTDTFESISL